MKSINSNKLSKHDATLYEQYVDSITPTTSLRKNMLFAFLIGGSICTIGELIKNIFIHIGLSSEDAGLLEIIILIFLSILLTGLGIYKHIAKYGGAGTLVPITGFANSIASCAIEFKKEGQIFGIGCKIFTIAGPVILYGLVSSFIFGLIYFFIH